MDPEAAPLPGIVDAPPPPRLTAAASTGEPSPSPRPTATPVTAAYLRPEPIPLLPAGESLSFHQIDMLDAQRGWGIVGVDDRDQHIVRTEDGGRTWIDSSPPTLVYGGECGDQAVLRAVDAQTAWAGYLHSGAPSEQDLYCSRAPIYDLWKTEDGGKTWRMGSFVQGASGGSSQDGSGFPLLEFVDSQYGWAYRSFFRGAGSSEPQFYQTIDGGRTWRWFPDTYLFRITGIDFLDLKRGWATQSYGFGFYPSFSLGQTHDGGATWEFREIPPPGNPDHFSDCLVKSPSMRTATAGQIIALCWDVDREVEWFSYDTSDGGQSWRI